MGSDFLYWDTLLDDFILPPTCKLCDSVVMNQKPLVLFTNPFHYCINKHMLQNLDSFSSQTYLIVPFPSSSQQQIVSFVARSNDTRQ